LKDLSFNPQQLKDILNLLIKNKHELLEFALNASSHWPSGDVQLALQLGEALPNKLVKSSSTRRLCHSGYLTNCPNQFGDRSCKLCNRSCSFVVSTTNYTTVRIASTNAQKPTKSDGNMDDVRKF
jgi:hypothetical protein